MTGFEFKKIRFKPKQTTISASDLNALAARIERLEKIRGIGLINVQNTVSGPHVGLSTSAITDLQLVEAATDICTNRNMQFKGYPIGLDKSGVFYSPEIEPWDTRAWPFSADTSKAFYFRNPLWFSGTIGDWCIIAKFPNLGGEYCLIQIMCPGASASDDICDGTENKPSAWDLVNPAAGPIDPSARFRMPIPALPGILNKRRK